MAAAMYRIFRNKWITPPKEVKENYTGRCIIVTGATAGIGVEAAYKFAALGAKKVIIAARDLKKGEETRRKLETRLKRNDQFEVWKLDMMSYDSCRAFAEKANHLEQLDIVILNAGTRRTKYYESTHGWEEALQVNTLSTTLLALLLLPKLRQSGQHSGTTPILEFVNSGLHESAVVPEDIRKQDNVLAHYNTKEQFGEGKQYKFSKVFLMYATRQLADSISSKDVIITSICPGMVKSDLGRDHFFPGVWILAYFFVLLFMRTPSQGANMLLSGTTQGEAVHGRFWRHDQIQPIPASLKGDEMKHLGYRVFNEIIEALGKDVPDIKKILSDALSRI